MSSIFYGFFTYKLLLSVYFRIDLFGDSILISDMFYGFMGTGFLLALIYNKGE